MFICLIFSLNYGYTYAFAPFFLQSEDAKRQNAEYIPYGLQERNDVLEV